MIPVDERVNIYSSYTDDLYNKFIEEGKKFTKNITKKIIAIQKMINYYFILIIVHLKIHLSMVDINVIKKLINGIKIIVNLIIVI